MYTPRHGIAPARLLGRDLPLRQAHPGLKFSRLGFMVKIA